MSIVCFPSIIQQQRITTVTVQ